MLHIEGRVRLSQQQRLSSRFTSNSWTENLGCPDYIVECVHSSKFIAAFGYQMMKKRTDLKTEIAVLSRFDRSGFWVPLKQLPIWF